MPITWLIAAGLAVFLTAAISCARVDPQPAPGMLLTVGVLERDPGMAELLLVQRADPAAALAAALARGDTRLLGIANFSLEVPGPERADELAHTKYGVREINGGGDHGISDARMQLIQGARDYAARYNTMLLRHLKELPDP